MAIPSWLKKDKDSVLYNGDGYFAFFIPENYFNAKNSAKAIIMGEIVNLFGVLDYQLFSATGKPNGPIRCFKFPTVFLTKPTSIEKIKNVKLVDWSDAQDYRVLKYEKGAQIVMSTKVPQDLQNVEFFYSLFLEGNLPVTIPYEDLYTYLIENIQLAGENYGITNQLLGIIVSEMARDPDNLEKAFRNSKAKHYKAINIKDIPKFISPYSAITSENWDEAVVNAIENQTTRDIPMEKILMD